VWVQTPELPASGDTQGCELGSITRQEGLAGSLSFLIGLGFSSALQLGKYLQALSFEHRRSCCAVPLRFPP